MVKSARQLQRSRGRLLALLSLGAVGAWLARWSVGPSTFLQADDDSIAATWWPVHWVHHQVVLASHTGYPVPFMIPFNLYGNVLLRKACGGQRYPTWLFGYILGFLCYTYPSAILSDVLFVMETPRAMSNDYVLVIYTVCFVVIQNCDTVYCFLVQPRAFSFLFTLWLADSTRASICFLERAVTHQAVFARGVFHAFVWVCAGPLFRMVEARIRGGVVHSFDEVQPDSANFFRYPLLGLLATQLFYLIYISYFTPVCDIFAEDPTMTMVECGQLHNGLFAGIVYFTVLLNFVRFFRIMFLPMGDDGVVSPKIAR